MSSIGSDDGRLGTRANQEETSPFPLELMLAAALACQRDDGAGQDETAPFPLDFEIVSRGVRRSQDETAPFPLEFMVMRPDGEVALVRTAPLASCAFAPGAGTPLPRLTWRGLDASAELREYAARIASGEDLPPFRGPILANDALPASVPAASPSRRRAAAPPRESATDSKAFLKLALSLIVMSAVLVAASVLGDDAQLRAAGQTIGSWFQGPERSIETFPLADRPGGGAGKPCDAPQP